MVRRCGNEFTRLAADRYEPQITQIAHGPTHSIHTYTISSSRENGDHRSSSDLPSFSVLSVCSCSNLPFLNRSQRRKRRQELNPPRNSAAIPRSDFPTWGKWSLPAARVAKRRPEFDANTTRPALLHLLPRPSGRGFDPRRLHLLGHRKVTSRQMTRQFRLSGLCISIRKYAVLSRVRFFRSS